MPKTSQPTKQNRLKVLYVALPPIIVQWNHSVKKEELGSITGQDFIPIYPKQPPEIGKLWGC